MSFLKEFLHGVGQVYHEGNKPTKVGMIGIAIGTTVMALSPLVIIGERIANDGQQAPATASLQRDIPEGLLIGGVVLDIGATSMLVVSRDASDGRSRGNNS